LLCSLSLPLPCAALFPYTTLFRSVAARVDRVVAGRPRGIVVVDARGRVGEQLAHLVRVERRRSRLRVAAHRGKRAADVGVPSTQDRKSTRLNSSHEWISYAVFCLK